MFIKFDIVNQCNLRCPSCPSKRKEALEGISIELFNKILFKLINECREIEGICLFNWSEPFLHPYLPELVSIVNSHGIKCYLSTNLNVPYNYDDVLKENPYSLRVSMSGFSELTYNHYHKGGDINRVKRNLIELSKSVKRTNSKTAIHVCYHRYKDNLDEELLLKQFVENLGFKFMPVWALLLPMERVLDAYDDKNLSKEDYDIIDRLIIHPRKALDITKQKACLKCHLRDNQLVISSKGDVQLCCALYDSKYIVANILNTSVEEIQKLRSQHPYCDKCMALNGTAYTDSASTALYDYIMDQPFSVNKTTLEYLNKDYRKNYIKNKLKYIYENYLSSIIPLNVAKYIGDKL